MWCLAFFALADSLTTTYAVPVAPAETLAVTVAGRGRAVVRLWRRVSAPDRQQ